jgi:acyl carrier protein
MTRSEIQTWLLQVFAERFEIEDPGLDDDLREVHEFDSIDAIELLASIEDWLGFRLSQDDKKEAMEIRTLDQIIDYILMLRERQQAPAG